MVWYSHLFQNFPQFIVIHTVKGFGIVSKAEIDVFLELSCFFYGPADVGNLISGDFGGLYTVTIGASGNVNPSLLSETIAFNAIYWKQVIFARFPTGA